MANKKSQSSDKKLRADAQRNRDRLLAVARKAFIESGANTSLDAIAKQAGVGPGTLYRHFPTREDLLKAVFRAAAEELAQAGQEFAQTLPPVEALRAWMLFFVDRLAEKRIIAPALQELVGDPKQVFEASYAQICEAVQALVKRGIDSGDLREDLNAMDLLRALVGFAHVAETPDWQESAKRLVDILILGSRPGT